MKLFGITISNRRTDNDRRSEESGPPSGWADRRHTVERRLPEVREATLAEWVGQFRRQRTRREKEAAQEEAAQEATQE
jgi:hypothetical protein